MMSPDRNNDLNDSQLAICLLHGTGLIAGGKTLQSPYDWHSKTSTISMQGAPPEVDVLRI